MLLQWHKKAMFSRFSENVKSLLSGAVQGCKAAQDTPNLPSEEESTSLDTLAQSMVAFPQDPTLSANVNCSSPLKPAAGTTRKRKGRKRVHIMTDHIPDENKTTELKSIEAFFISHQPQVEDLELAGGEDPIVLHYVITNLPSIVAHREVHKFKKRPQYLEMLVHLLSSTLAKGHHDRVLEWLAEGFQWIAKRNEILLNPKVAQRVVGEQAIFGKIGMRGSLPKTSCLVSSLPSKADMKRFAQRAISASAQRETSAKEPGRSSKQPPREHSGTNKTSKPPPREHSGTSNKSSKPHSGETDSKGKRSTGASLHKAVVQGAMGRRESPHTASALQQYIRKSLVPNLAAELSRQVRITKEDLEAKSAIVLINKLPEMWRAHKCR